MLLKFVTSATGVHCYSSAPQRESKTQLHHCSCSNFDRAEKSACVSGVNQCTATKRRLKKSKIIICLMMIDRITKLVTV